MICMLILKQIGPNISTEQLQLSVKAKPAKYIQEYLEIIKNIQKLEGKYRTQEKYLETSKGISRYLRIFQATGISWKIYKYTNLRRLSSKSVLYILLFYTAVLLNQIYVRSQFPFSSGIIRDLVCPNFSLVSGLDSYTLNAGSISYSLQVQFPILSRFSFLFSPG